MAPHAKPRTLVAVACLMTVQLAGVALAALPSVATVAPIDEPLPIPDISCAGAVGFAGTFNGGGVSTGDAANHYHKYANDHPDGPVTDAPAGGLASPTGLALLASASTSPHAFAGLRDTCLSIPGIAAFT